MTSQQLFEKEFQSKCFNKNGDFDCEDPTLETIRSKEWEKESLELVDFSWYFESGAFMVFDQEKYFGGSYEYGAQLDGLLDTIWANAKAHFLKVRDDVLLLQAQKALDKIKDYRKFDVSQLHSTGTDPAPIEKKLERTREEIQKLGVEAAKHEDGSGDPYNLGLFDDGFLNVLRYAKADQSVFEWLAQGALLSPVVKELVFDIFDKRDGHYFISSKQNPQNLTRLIDIVRKELYAKKVEDPPKVDCAINKVNQSDIKNECIVMVGDAAFGETQICMIADPVGDLSKEFAASSHANVAPEVLNQPEIQTVLDVPFICIPHKGDRVGMLYYATHAQALINRKLLKHGVRTAPSRILNEVNFKKLHYLESITVTPYHKSDRYANFKAKGRQMAALEVLGSNEGIPVVLDPCVSIRGIGMMNCLYPINCEMDMAFRAYREDLARQLMERDIEVKEVVKDLKAAFPDGGYVPYVLVAKNPKVKAQITADIKNIVKVANEYVGAAAVDTGTFLSSFAKTRAIPSSQVELMLLLFKLGRPDLNQFLYEGCVDSMGSLPPGLSRFNNVFSYTSLNGEDPSISLLDFNKYFCHKVVEPKATYVVSVDLKIVIGRRTKEGSKKKDAGVPVEDVEKQRVYFKERVDDIMHADIAATLIPIDMIDELIYDPVYRGRSFYFVAPPAPLLRCAIVVVTKIGKATTNENISRFAAYITYSACRTSLQMIIFAQHFSTRVDFIQWQMKNIKHAWPDDFSKLLWKVSQHNPSYALFLSKPTEKVSLKDLAKSMVDRSRTSRHIGTSYKALERDNFVEPPEDDA